MHKQFPVRHKQGTERSAMGKRLGHLGLAPLLVHIWTHDFRVLGIRIGCMFIGRCGSGTRQIQSVSLLTSV